MDRYLCHGCAISLGHLRPAAPIALTATQYQLEKYLKHTLPTSAVNFITVFTSPASSTYRDFLVTTVASGHVQIDDAGRYNVVWVASRDTGIATLGGSIVGTTDAVKVVLQHDDNRIHAFPIASSDLRFTNCIACNRAIPY
jgi:hypothetical protein